MRAFSSYERFRRAKQTSGDSSGGNEPDRAFFRAVDYGSDDAWDRDCSDDWRDWVGVQNVRTAVSNWQCLQSQKLYYSSVSVRPRVASVCLTSSSAFVPKPRKLESVAGLHFTSCSMEPTPALMSELSVRGERLRISIGV